MSAVFVTFATSPVYLRLRKDCSASTLRPNAVILNLPEHSRIGRNKIAVGLRTLRVKQQIGADIVRLAEGRARAHHRVLRTANSIPHKTPGWRLEALARRRTPRPRPPH